MGQRIEWKLTQRGTWEAAVGQVLGLSVEPFEPGQFIAKVEQPDSDAIERLPGTFSEPVAAQRAAERRARQMLQEALEALEVDQRVVLVFAGIKNPEGFGIIVERHQGHMLGVGPVQVGVDDAELAASLVSTTIGLVESVRFAPLYTPTAPQVGENVRQVRRGLLVRVERDGSANAYRVLDTEGEMHRLSGVDAPDGNPQGGTVGWLTFTTRWHFTPDE